MGSVYLADIMNFCRITVVLLVATFAAIWIGFHIGNVVAVWSTIAPCVVLLNAPFFMLLVAAWAMIHIRWIALHFPEFTVRSERLVTGLLPFATLPSVVSTCAALAGSKHAAFLIAAAMCAVHSSTGAPRAASRF